MTFHTELKVFASLVLVAAIALIGACASADNTKYTASIVLVGGDTLIMPLRASKADCERTQSMALSQAREFLSRPENAKEQIIATDCTALVFHPVTP